MDRDPVIYKTNQCIFYICFYLFHFNQTSLPFVQI